MKKSNTSEKEGLSKQAWDKALSQLRAWFSQHQRKLPWREKLNIAPCPESQEATAYRVWVSEVMLQQTQVATVLPYFERWMQRFPDLEQLAKAPQSDVIKAWEGLGYYSRARNLQAAAQQILKQGGSFPKTEEDLSQLKGLGPYTVGAILNFAFKKKAAALDGNVIRVLTRYLGIFEDICSSKTQKELRKTLFELLPEQAPWEISEALIELGALVCKKQNPKCERCPLANSCFAKNEDQVEALPFKSKKIEITPLYRQVAVIENAGFYLVVKRPQGAIMAGLYEFPYLEMEEENYEELDVGGFEKTLGLQLELLKTLKPCSHHFTRYRARLLPFVIQPLNAKSVTLSKPYQWVAREELKNYAFSSGHLKIVKQVYKP